MLWLVPTSAFAQKTISTAGSNCSVATACATFGVRGMDSFGIYLDVGTSGTFNFEATVDGVNWFAVADDVTAATSKTADGAVFFSNPGYSYIRVRASAISGNATVTGLQGYAGLRSTATLTGGGGDGAIIDGVSAAIKATVADLTNSNPVAAMIVDTNGTQITSFGGGTQFAEDVASANADVGTLAMARRTATPANTSGSDLDYETLQINAGRLWTSATIDAALPAGNNNIGDVDIVTVPAPLSTTGNGSAATSLRVTLANDSTGTTAVTNAGTFATQAAQTGTWNITNVSGTVSLPTGASTAAKQPGLGTAGNPSADVISIQGITSGTAVPISGSITCSNCSGTGVSVNEDVASANADPGTPAYSIRQDTPSGLTSADGDYQPLKTDSVGRLWVNCGTGCAGGTQFAEDAASANADVGTLAMARRTATPANTSGADLDYEVLQMNSGRLWVDASGVTLTVASHAVTNAGTFAVQSDTELGAAVLLADNISLPTVPIVGAANLCYDGTNLDLCRTSTLTEATHDGALTASTTVGSTPMFYAKAAAPTDVSADGDAVLPWALRNGSQVMNVAAGSTLITATSTSLNVNCTGGCSGGTQYTHDGALTIGSSSTTLAGARASAAVPTDVSADNDAVALWALRSGALATQPTFGGVLGVAGNGASGTGVQRVTIANDSTGILAAVTSITNTVTVAGAKTNNNAAPGATNVGALTVLANAAAPTWTEGNLVALSSDLAGALRVAGSISCSNCSGTGVSVNEDVASANADPGTPAYAVRQDTPAGSTSADGDYTPLKSDSLGRLWVNCGTGCSGGAQYTHDAALTIGSSSTTLAGGRASAAVPTDVSADNDAVAAWYLRSGAQAVQPTFAGVLGVAGNGVSGTGVQRVTIASDSTGQVTLATGAATIGALTANQSVNVAQINGVTTTMGNGVSGTGVQRVTLASDSTGQVAVTGTVTVASHAVTNAGTFLVQENGGALTSLSLLDDVVRSEDAASGNGHAGDVVLTVRQDTPIGDTSADGDYTFFKSDSVGRLHVNVGNTSLAVAGVAAHDAVASGNPVLLGAYAKTAAPTAVSADGDVAQLWSGRNGQLAVMVVDGSGNLVTQATDATTNTTTQTTGPQIFANGSAATPSAVGADGRSIALWADTVGRLQTNVAQINGVAPLMGAGNTGTGSPRVTISTDQAALPGMGVGATGAAPPANANYLAGITSGATGGLLSAGIPVCDQQAFLDMTTATTTEIIPLTSSRTVHICHIRALSNGTTVMTFKKGTGTNCGTGTAAIDSAYDLTAQTGFSSGTGIGEILSGVTSANAVCVTSSAAVNLHVFMRYAVY